MAEKKDLSLTLTKILSKFNKKILNKILQPSQLGEINEIDEIFYINLFIEEIEDLIDNLGNIINKN